MVERLAYDPWGKRRNIQSQPGQPDPLDQLVGQHTERGYTEHEHLDEVGVIHMNGRIFDPLMGRFMSADPEIQEPLELKSFNRYSYVWNNPLGMTDPTGYFSWNVGGPNDNTNGTGYTYTSSDGSRTTYGCSGCTLDGGAADYSGHSGGGGKTTTTTTVNQYSLWGYVQQTTPVQGLYGFVHSVRTLGETFGAAAAGIHAIVTGDDYMLDQASDDLRERRPELFYTFVGLGTGRILGPRLPSSRGSVNSEGPAAGGTAALEVNGAAASAKQGADLSRHLRYMEKYGAGGVEELQNGRIRYYGEVQSANKAGEMAGRRYVHEFDPATGRTRGWHEVVDHAGNVRQVRPELNNGSKTHYQFDVDGNYTGSW